MSGALLTAPDALVVAEPDRRFYAFALDRAIAWLVLTGAAVAAYLLFLDDGAWLPGTGVLLAAVLVVWLVSGLLTGLGGATPGKSVAGLRVLDVATGRPVGLGRALLRHAVLGLTTLPTLGIGVATLAWMASVDPSGNRRSWHDRVARSVVVDVRRREDSDTVADEEPRRIVNLTAMRLMPAPPAPEQPAPARRLEDSTFTGSHPVGPPTPRPGRHAAPVAPAAPVVRAAPEAPAPVGPAVPVAPPAPVAATSAAPPSWRITFDTGQSLVVTGLALIGRGPEPAAGDQVAHLVALPSSDMSLSKTHAQVQVVPDGTLVVMDRGSTNGSTLVRQGVSRSLGVRKPATLRDGDRVRFGDREMQVSRA